jgi:ABC-type phosphonate transport system ATPase subunit
VGELTTATRVGSPHGSPIDVYPARVEHSSFGHIGTARARVTAAGRLMVWVDSDVFPHNAMLILDETIDTVIQNTMANRQIVPRKQHLVVMTDKRDVITIKRANGCGCGSRLKAGQQMPEEIAATAAEWLRRNQAQQLSNPQQSDIEMVLAQHFPHMQEQQ